MQPIFSCLFKSFALSVVAPTPRKQSTKTSDASKACSKSSLKSTAMRVNHQQAQGNPVQDESSFSFSDKSCRKKHLKSFRNHMKPPMTLTFSDSPHHRPSCAVGPHKGPGHDARHRCVFCAVGTGRVDRDRSLKAVHRRTPMKGTTVLDLTRREQTTEHGQRRVSNDGENDAFSEKAKVGDFGRSPGVAHLVQCHS